MDSFEINITTFINPHCFFINEADSKRRSVFLQDVSLRIKKNHLGLQNQSFIIDEMVAVYHDSDLVRATLMEISANVGTGKTIYSCWLVDYAILIKTEKVFKLPKEIQKITPRAKQACLNNFCYVHEQLELGVTGKIKRVPSMVPYSGVTQFCLEVMLNGYSKLVFEVSERYNNILIGEILIHKQGKVLCLTKELCDRGLIVTDELLFERIKFSTKDYIKMNLDKINQACKTQRIASPVPCSKTTVSPIKNEENDLEELDIDKLEVLENGRRRRRSVLNKSLKSGSEDETLEQQSPSKVERLLNKLKQSPKTINEKESFSESVRNTNLKESETKCEVFSEQLNKSVGSVLETDKNNDNPILGKRSRLLQLAKEKKILEEAKKASEEDTSKGLKSVQKKLAELRLRKQHRSNCSTRSEEGFDSSCDSSLESNKNEQTQDSTMSSEMRTPTSVVPSNTSESESKKSPFADLTSQRKAKPTGLFLPAGMESRSNQGKSVVKQKASKESKFKKDVLSASFAPNDDCPTIKIPKLSGNLTDDQISAEEIKSEKVKEEESSSDQMPPEVFTKQDFCRLIAGCTCVKCRIALEDDDWDGPIQFAPTEVETRKKRESTGPVIKPPKLLKVEVENDTQIKPNDILSIDYSGMTIMEKKMSCKVLVHGESIPNPIKRVAEVHIHKDIYNNITRLNYKEAKRIQHYAFPAITRNQHVFMINDTRSGKTMAYLPILSSFVMEKEERYSQLFKMGGGPIVVILCSNSKKCEEVYDLTKLIFDRMKCRVSLVTYPGHGNISNIDILITMPTILTSLISSRATNFKRLCHFVLEDGDVILKTHHELIKKFLEYGDQVLGHRHCPKSIQIIVCSEHWTSHIENILKSLNKVPLVCIGNYLEAALYGNLNFTMKFLETGCKDQTLQRIVHDVYNFTKTIIICNPDEINEIVDFLPLKGIEFVAVTDETVEDISDKEVFWSKATPGKYSVLICTDDIYNTMNITNAQLLIHYSLPRSWTQFIRRFSCLLENNPTPLNIKQRKEIASTFVFIDENCEPRMSKFCNFLKIAGLEQFLPEKMKAFLQVFALEGEQNRIQRKIEMCETLKIFGKCDYTHCKKRHVLDKELDHSEVLPKNGSIKFKIVKMTNVATCSIKLLEHYDLNGHRVEKFQDVTSDISEILAQTDKYHQVSEPRENHLYLHKDGDGFWRCKLLEMEEYALVYLIDRGIYCKSNLNMLFRMPEDLKKIPQQCYEVHFAKLIPPHEDATFSRSAKHKAQFSVDSNCPNAVMTARIVLQLGNNLWLDDLCEVREMHDKSLPSIGYQLSRELQKQELAVKSEKPLENLYALCQNAGIVLPEYQAEKPIIKRRGVEQLTPQWAFLEQDSINRVRFSCGISPGEFYVKHQKFCKQLAQLEKDIQKEIRKPFYPQPQQIEVGKCYLAKDPPTGYYSRVLVLNMTDNDAHVFFVDYGDDVFVPVSTLKHLSNELILKLPFQTIQCSMYGIKPIDDSWCQASGDLLYKMGFEDGSDDFFRTLYVKTCSKTSNDLIAKQNSYSVIVKEGFSERLLVLNELLIDCGFAIPNGDEIRDFELPDKDDDGQDEKDEEEEDIEEIIDTGRDIVLEEYDRPTYFDEDAFDMEISNIADFMMDMNLPVRKISDQKAIEEKRNNDLPPMKAVPPVDYLTPQVYWSQTDSSIKLAIQIHDVKEPKMALKHNRIFQFSTENDGKRYQVRLILYGTAEKTLHITVLGPEVRVKLTKCAQEEWPRLLHTKDKMKNIHFDTSSIKDDEKPRKVLQLDISESSSEDDESDGMIYHVCSDLDSEYDYDIPNDDQY